MKSIDIDSLVKKIEKEQLNIIDIRTYFEYQYGRIPTAINIDKFFLIKTPEKYLKKEKTYYIYCNSGISSNRVVEVLNQKGYDTVNINGGYNNYLLRK
ncbi:MAG: rhodanese-like domain-containing protein [Bacilli bacterium]|nr:rhodanese-like domain-containing protein [Bacilli bacterium]